MYIQAKDEGFFLNISWKDIDSKVDRGIITDKDKDVSFTGSQKIDNNSRFRFVKKIQQGLFGSTQLMFA